MWLLRKTIIPAGIYSFKVQNGNSRMCEIYSKLIIKTQEQHHGHRSDIFIVNFGHTSHNVQVFALLTLNKQMPALGL